MNGLVIRLQATNVYQFADADIRLAGSAAADEGRLEVKVAGIWGTVCDDDFDDHDAGVACYMLGLGYVSKCSTCFFDRSTGRNGFCSQTE